VGGGIWRRDTSAMLKHVKECIIVGFSPVPREVPPEVQLYIRSVYTSVRACVQLYLYTNTKFSKSSY
jgi:hypothetical protein